MKSFYFLLTGAFFFFATSVHTAMSTLNVYLGHRLGLYKSLAETGAVTPETLSRKSGYSERYLREWLECMAVGGQQWPAP